MNVKWERIARFALAAAAVVALVIIGPTSGAAQKKGKGKKNTPDLVRIEFLEPSELASGALRLDQTDGHLK